MRVHYVQYGKPEEGLDRRRIWGRSLKWAASTRKRLRRSGFKIEKSGEVNIPLNKAGLIEWLNAQVKEEVP
jgi:hypothetical protein